MKLQRIDAARIGVLAAELARERAQGASVIEDAGMRPQRLPMPVDRFS